MRSDNPTSARFVLPLWPAVGVLLMALGLAGCAPQPTPELAQTPVDPAQAERGAYLARLGNCEHCHTVRGGEPYAGGRAIDTPFGQVYSGNITPDRVNGLGRWSADDFWNALHHGKSQNGRLLYPAFPYTSYTHVTRADSDALWAYLRTVKPSSQESPEHALRWPYSTQLALWGWRFLYFTDDAEAAAATAPANATDPLVRGRYLVQGLGHCDECHAARNALGAVRTEGPQGHVLGGARWYAPSLLDRSEASVADWTEDDVVALLTTGVSARGHVLGPMADVVRYGTQYLTDTDAHAMATYLRQLPQTASRPRPDASAAASPELDAFLQQGKGLYDKHCDGCHGMSGEGQPGVYPALAASRTVSMARTNNLAHVVLRGGYAPSTQGNPRPYGMPPFVLTLSDAEMAAVLSYIRYQWGNTGSPVAEFDITSMRR